MSDLAATLAEEGSNAKAEKLARETLDEQRRVLAAPDHRIIGTMDNLAVILGRNGRLAESERLKRETIDTERPAYGPNHLGVLSSMGNLADTLYLMGRYAEARPPVAKDRSEIEDDPDLNSLHGDARFDALVTRAKRRGVVSKSRCPLG